MKKNIIDDIIDDALHAACAAVQKRFGVTDGGLAGDMFSGRTREKEMFYEAMRSYILREAQSGETDAHKLAEPMGYEIASTGGGCCAFRKDLDDGSFLLVCDDGNHVSAPPDAREWMIGRHRDDGSFIEIAGLLNLRDALVTAQLIPWPAGERGDNIQETFDDIHDVKRWVDGLDAQTFRR